MLEFNKRLQAIECKPEHIIKLGYSQRTAYSWLKGTRQPKEYLQNKIIRELKDIIKKGG